MNAVPKPIFYYCAQTTSICKFTPQVKALSGKRITVAGWMMPLTAGRTQKHFVLLGHPPGCPFHANSEFIPTMIPI